MSLVMIIIVGVIGIYVADTVSTETAITTPDANSSTAQWTFYNMSNDLYGAGETGSGFIIILVIAFIGGIAITYMFGIMRRK